MSTSTLTPRTATTHTAQRSNQNPVVMLAGNPNAGKTSLFNALTGLRQKVANYPGVTVERVEGQWSLSASGNGDVSVSGSSQSSSQPLTARVIDLPGLYSLDALSPDEQIARCCLAGEAAGVPAPDVIIAVVDTTNLERNLYLFTQLLEYRKPIVVALTMFDTATRRNLKIDTAKLAARLSVPVVPVIVSTEYGLDELRAAVRRELVAPSTVESFSWETNGESKAANSTMSDDDGTMNDATWNAWQSSLEARYRWIEDVVADAISTPESNRIKSGSTSHVKADNADDLTMRIDRWATHKVFGLLIFVGLMLLVFQSIFAWASLPMDLIDQGFGTLGALVRAGLPEGLFTDLLVDGIIAGVGGVLVFLPQICLLFLFIALLEDTGYMARAAFLMDRLMRGVGLHGKAFVPLLSSFACAIPGIMATRTIENPRDRIATIMIAPLMSCSARLPVYTLMIAAFFADRRVFGFLSLGALIILAMYALGIVAAIVVATLLKRTLLRAPTPPLVMELPPYRVPQFRVVAHTVMSRAWMFIRRAGTVILAISILLWGLVTFPRTAQLTAEQQSAVTQSVRETGLENGATAAADDEVGANTVSQGAQLRGSFAGRFGQFIEPVIAPLGFDWRIGIGLISSFAAREVFVSTMSIVYNVGAEATEEDASLITAFTDAQRDDGSPAWTPLVAVSLMVFFVLACQCMSTVAIARRETNSWTWALFMVAYMLVLAYAASFITYQGGRLLGFA